METSEIPTRTLPQVAEAMKYGKVYVITKVMAGGTRIQLVRFRYDSKKRELYSDESEKRIIHRRPNAKINVGVGHLFFQDTRNEWSYWEINNEVKNGIGNTQGNN